jgi:hypothetical protein
MPATMAMLDNDKLKAFAAYGALAFASVLLVSRLWYQINMQYSGPF